MVDGGLMEMAKGNEVDHSKRDGENMTGGKGNACRDTRWSSNFLIILAKHHRLRANWLNRISN